MKKILSLIVIAVLCLGVLTGCAQIEGLLGQIPGIDNIIPGLKPEHVHTEVVDAAVEATCTTEGKTEGKHCSECNEVIVAQQTVPAKGHTEVVDAAVAATCTTAGKTEGKHCSVCNEVLVAQEEIPASHYYVLDICAICYDVRPSLVLGDNTVVVPAAGSAFGMIEITEAGTYKVTDASGAIVCIFTESIFAEGSDFSIAADGTLGASWYKFGTEGELQPGFYYVGVYGEGEHTVNLSKKVEPAAPIVNVSDLTAGTTTGDELVAGSGISASAGLTIEGNKKSIDGFDFTQRLKLGGTMKAEDGAVSAGIKIVTTGAGKIVVYAIASSGDATDRYLQLATLTEEGLVQLAKTESYVDGAAIAKYEFSVDAAGTYYLGSTKSGINLYYIAVEYGTTPPVEEGYKATLDNEFSSEKANALVLALGKYGSWGIDTNGSFKSETGAPEIGAIGGLDSAGKYVYYEFILNEAGTVDIIWNIAGSNWDGSGNAGIADMANHMTLTIDGEEVDIAGIALPAGEGDVPAWWNLQNVVIKGVQLEAGVHTIKCDITAAGGLNVGPMTIKSDKALSVKSAEVTKVDLVQKEDKIYYAITANINGYTVEDIKVWSDSNEYTFTTEAGENGATVILIDVTEFAINDKINPHMSLAGKNYVNGANANGDVRGENIVYEEKVVKNGDKYYQLYTEWSMPSLMVIQAVSTVTAADVYVEGDKVYYTLTYTVIGYDPAKFEFFDGNTVFPYTHEVNGNTVVYKFDATQLPSGTTVWPHLRIDGNNWNGTNGDVKVPVTEKTVELGGKTYTLKNQYDLPTLVVG